MEQQMKRPGVGFGAQRRGSSRNGLSGNAWAHEREGGSAPHQAVLPALVGKVSAAIAERKARETEAAE